MKQTSDSIALRLRELQHHFDESFARPQDTSTTFLHKMLAIQAGEGRVVVRLSEIGGIHACPPIVALPSPRPSLLGIVGVRGRLLAVYSLAALLRAPNAEVAPRWLLLPQESDQIALAVEGIDAFLNIESSALYPGSSAGDGDALCPEILHYSSTSRPVLSIPRTVAAVQKDAEASIPAPATKEP